MDVLQPGRDKTLRVRVLQLGRMALEQSTLMMAVELHMDLVHELPLGNPVLGHHLTEILLALVLELQLGEAALVAEATLGALDPRLLPGEHHLPLHREPAETTPGDILLEPQLQMPMMPLHLEEHWEHQHQEPSMPRLLAHTLLQLQPRVPQLLEQAGKADGVQMQLLRLQLELLLLEQADIMAHQHLLHRQRRLEQAGLGIPMTTRERVSDRRRLGNKEKKLFVCLFFPPTAGFCCCFNWRFFFTLL